MRANETGNRDRAILRALKREGRLTNADLAERVHVCVSTCLRRARIVEESGLIAGYVLVLDPAAAGLPGPPSSSSRWTSRDARRSIASMRGCAGTRRTSNATRWRARPIVSCASPIATPPISSASAIPPRAALHREPRPTSTLLRLRTIPRRRMGEGYR